MDEQNQPTTTDQVQNTAQNQPPSPSVEPVISKAEKKSKKGLWLALCLLLLIALGIGAYFLLHKPAKHSIQQSTVKKDITNLRYGSTQDSMNHFYPDLTGEGVEFDYNAQVYEGLVKLGDNYTGIKPLLAESWTNPDDSTWLFKLRKNVKFQDGKTFTANDVKHSFDLAVNSYVGPYITTTIDKITVVDDNTVSIHTKTPDPILLNKLVFMFIADDSVKPASGTGPLMPDPSSQATKDTATLVAFDGYHDGHPTTRKITFQYYPDSQAITRAFKDNKLDVAPDVLLSDTSGLPSNISTVRRSQYFISFLGFNTKDPKSPLSKLNVRKAIYESIDADAFMKAREVTGNTASQLIPSGIPGNDPTLTRPARNVDDAKKLLTDAGYPKGFTLTFSYLTQIPQAAVDVIVKNLADVGITVKQDPYTDAGTYFKKEAGQLSFYADGCQTLLFDASDILTTALIPDNYNDPELDTLLNKASTTFDPAQRLKTLKAISKNVMDNLLVAPMYNRDQLDLVRSNIHYSKGQIISGLGSYLWNAYSE